MPPATRWFRVRALAALTAIGLAFAANGASATPARPPAPSTLIKQSPTTWLLILATFSDYRPDEVIGELHRRLIKVDYRLGRYLSRVQRLSPAQRFLLARAAANYIKMPQIQTPTVRLCEQFVFVLGPESAWALDAVAADLSDRLGENHWYWAGRIIKRLGPRAKPLVPRLVELIDRAGTVDSMSSEPLVIALGAIGPHAAPAVPGLLRLFESPPVQQFDFIEPRNRAIIHTLGRIGPHAAEAEPLLKRIAREEVPSHFRTAATVAASRVLPDDPEIRRLVVERLLLIDLTERGAMAAVCLRNAATLRPAVEATLTEAMQSPNLNARLSAARALASLSGLPSDTLNSLALLGAQDDQPALRAICIAALGERRVRSDDARRVILAALQADDPLGRAAAERALRLLRK